MKKIPVIFIAGLEYDNLGIGYICAVLRQNGFTTRVIDVKKSRSEILRSVREFSPGLIGFGIIFQYHLQLFIDLVIYLRESGIKCHFTAGGHYASLRTEELFGFLPHLDSIVRFEGESTMLQLAGRIASGKPWKDLDGIAYNDSHRIILNKIRPVEGNLDEFPFPLRSPLKKYAFGLPFTTILAGRGCTHNCTFCNTRKFFRLAGAPLRRIREPEKVVEEIGMLYRTRKCTVFLFADDDFPVKTAYGNRWVERFCLELERKKLENRIIWNVCCRADEVELTRFRLMKEHGLFLVFLGIEDGTDQGLKGINKHVSAAMNRQSLGILRELKLGIDFGFLLFQPGSTFMSLRANLDFLRQICGDGYMPVTFLKMMPYYETRAEADLIRENRLKLSMGIRDYDFTDVRLDNYFHFITVCFGEWLRSDNGLEAKLNWARNNFLVYSRFLGEDREYSRLKRQLVKITSESNNLLLDTMENILNIFEAGAPHDPAGLESVKSEITYRHGLFRKKAGEIIDDLNNLALVRVTL